MVMLQKIICRALNEDFRARIISTVNERLGDEPSLRLYAHPSTLRLGVFVRLWQIQVIPGMLKPALMILVH